MPAAAASNDDDDHGLGILEFFHGKNIFITGATGLLGKALIEKLLRSTSVGKIYVLIKAEDKEAAVDRLRKEIVDSELFECVREKLGNNYNYQEFVKEKLIPVVGNVCDPNLGMDLNSSRAIMKDVDVIIESAASTTLNDRYDFLLDINVNAPQRLMRFAKTCKNLKLFVHMSTAYVNGRKEGLILEKPLIMGENGRKVEIDDDDEMSSSSSSSSSLCCSFSRVDLADEISLAMKSLSCQGASHHQDYDVTKNLKRLGLERANNFGWYNAYHMTKAMGEMVLNEIREEIPLLIIRPTVIESSYKQPFPGWIQGNRMFDPVIISYGKGQLPAYLADPKSTWISNINDLSKHTRDAILLSNEMGDAIDDEKMLRKLQSKAKAKVAYAEQLCKMYEFIGFIKG
ncbi:UNVERIFIED_CONTAM: Fatty acyl-CoA reductase 2, partial [Sesamum radiatum]